MPAFENSLYTSQERGKFPRPSEMWGAQMRKPSSQENPTGVKTETPRRRQPEKQSGTYRHGC